MTRNEVLAKARKIIEPEVKGLGFTEYDRHYFKRLRGDLCDVFFVDPDRQVRIFYVQVGIHLPSLDGRDRFLTGIDQPVAMVSHRLGKYCNPPESNRSYACYTVDQLNQYVPKMLDDFKRFALPWYDRFKSVKDVAAEWKRIRIDPRSELVVKQAGPRPPDPFGWAEYGWLLEQVGDLDEAKKWWQKAYDEVTRPLFQKNGNVVPAGTRGARPLRRPPEDDRLKELLRQSLGLPLPA